MIESDFCNPAISAATPETARYLIEGCLEEGELFRVYQCSECGRWHARRVSPLEVYEQQGLSLTGA